MFIRHARPPKKEFKEIYLFILLFIRASANTGGQMANKRAMENALQKRKGQKKIIPNE